ncbi:MAG: CDP-alcohol phosphatidyltransferase family protein [Acidimicrobiales bacterium]
MDPVAPDAGIPDAGIPDAGIPDAGIPGAGIPDAGIPDAGLDRIVTVPNLVTVIRMAAIPVFVILLARPDRAGWYPAALLLATLGVTDGVDGFLARRLHQVSTLGKVLDPLADRLLLGVAAISIIAVGAVPTWVAVAALAREAVVVIGFVLVAALGGRRMDVQLAGKAATFALMCALPLFLAGHSGADWHRVAEILAWVATVPALALGWYAVVTYIPKASASVAEGRAAGVARDRAGTAR